MNTYELLHRDLYRALSNHDQHEIKEFLLDTKTKDNVSIQLQTFKYGCEEDVVLYGAYDMTDEELANYNRNGGLWLYNTKNEIINQLGVS